MVKLRLRRKGRIRAPFYDIVAIDGRKRRDGTYLEIVGTYNPMTSPSTVNINHDRAMYWLGVGAQPTERVNSILSFDGVLLRRNLLGKGKSAEEVEATVIAHKEHALKRYNSNKYKRKMKRQKAAEGTTDAASEASAPATAVVEAPAPATE